MKLTNIILSCILAVCMASCDSFLDVRPKAEKVEKDLFKDAQGFEDAIYGVYGSLSQTPLYGKDLLWGVPEILAQNLTCGSTTMTALAKYQYTENDDLRTQLSSIWENAYKTIGYANNVLEQLDSWSPQSLPLYNLYKGEMLGVRAYLHFDLLRLFASMDMEAEGIPYVTSYSYTVKPFYKVGKVYEFIIADLIEAEQALLEEETSFAYPRDNSRYNKFENYRESHFNLYAVRALLARVYWMKGDMANAAKYATDVIDSEKFPLVNEAEVKDYLSGVLSTKETIFGVYAPKYVDTCSDLLLNMLSSVSFNPYFDGMGTSHLLPYDKLYQLDVDATSQDYRRNHFRANGSMAMCLKLVDYYTIEEQVAPEGWNNLIKGVTLMHVSELYLIAAEALLQSDYDRALGYFNDEIASRGLTRLRADQTLTLERIYNEYHKELFCEGQMWYNMKRLNKDIQSNAESKVIPGSDKVYVIPIPEEEYEYRD